MDPDKALEDLREQVESLRDLLDNDDSGTLSGRVCDIIETANTLVDSFGGLDDWLSKKGFLPKDWAR